MKSDVNQMSYECSEILSLAEKVFSAWDITKDGVITTEEIVTCSKLDRDFAIALGRVLKRGRDEEITCDSLVNCIKVLKRGTLQEKVELLFMFIDADGSKSITYDEIRDYLVALGDKGLEKLGLSLEEGTDNSISFSAMLAVFQNSVRGEAAITVFCTHILRLLTSQLNENTDKRVSKENSSRIDENSNPTGVSSYCSSTFSYISTSWHFLWYKLQKESVFYGALMLLQIMFWLINFFWFRGRGFPPAACAAKGFGLNLRVITIAMYCTMMRRIMGYLYTIRTLSPFIPVGFSIEIHSYLGFCMLLHATGHTIAHIIYHSMDVAGGFTSTFYMRSIISGHSWSFDVKGDAISGLILFVILLLMTGTALLRGMGSAYYRIFFLSHFGYILWPVFSLLHVPYLWPYFLAVTGLLVLERAYDFFYCTIRSTLVSSRPCSNEVTFLSVPRIRDTYPGSYYRIKVPALSQTEWHPFSLASGETSLHLTFFVASTGDWTKALYQLVSDPVKRTEAVVLVQGPFYAPAKKATDFSRQSTVLVASGIGITPFFSVMATKVAGEQNHEADKDIYEALFSDKLSSRGGSVTMTRIIKNKFIKNNNLDTSVPVLTKDVQALRVVWVVRECSELLFYIDYVYQLVKNQSNLNRNVVLVDVYLTSLGKSSDPMNMVTQTLLMVAVSDKTSQYMTVHFGRPDMQSILNGMKPHKVYYCGGPVMKDNLLNICREMGTHFHPEAFDAGTSYVQALESYFASWQKQRVMIQKIKQKQSKEGKEAIIPPAASTSIV